MTLLTGDRAMEESDELQPQEGEVYVLPSSYAQRSLWLVDRLAPGSSLYNIPWALRLAGRLDVEALAWALDEIVRRHETLRTTLAAEDRDVVQVIAPPEPCRLPCVDLAGLPGALRGPELRRRLSEEAARPFDLEHGPLIRALLLRLSATEHVLLLNLHHAIADGWSLGVLRRELAALYRGETLPELPIQYADFAAWQRELLSGGELERHLAWWREQLAEAPAVLDLPLVSSRPAVRSARGVRRSLALPPELGEALRALGRREGATPFVVLLAAFQTLVHRWTGQEDFLIGTPLAGRSQVETEGLVGLFANLVPLRAGFCGGADGPPFTEVLRRARESFLGTHAHQDLPFELLVEALQPVRSTSHAPLIQAIFTFEAAGGEAAGWPELAVEPVEIHHGEVKLDLGLSVEERPGGWLVRLDAAADLFGPASLLRLLDSYGALLAGAAAAPERPVGCLPVASGPVLHQALSEWNDTAGGPPDATIGRLFAERAAAAPGAVALEAGGEVWTYRELDERTNRLARHLIARGVGPEARVGVCLNRSAEAIEAILAVVKAGGVYVPLEPAYPRERLAWMIEDAAAPVVVTASPHLAALPEDALRTLVVLDRDREEIAARSAAPVESGATPDHLAYVVYTSGSTGRPKGVAVPHRAVVRLVRGSGFASLSADETWLQLAPIVFDASTLEIWGSLLNGARLAVFPDYQPSLEELGETIERQGVTSLWLTAGLFHQMAERPLERLRGVRQLLAGGDVLSVPHVEKVLARFPDLLLVNGYGPTENTTFTACHRMLGPAAFGSSVPIGRPVSGTRVVLLDRRLEPAPPGAVGELYAGGGGLARGYLGRPDLTAERFVPDPLGSAPGARLYRTGDLARWRPDGALEFLGRTDAQVKIRGFRIEPGEIEAAICLHPEVRQAVVAVREDLSSEKQLIAYVVLDPESKIQNPKSDLRAWLGERLPAHLIPAAFVALETLPLDPNGKVDRRALPAPEWTREDAGAGGAPATPLEEILAGMWSEVLGVERVGVRDDFFELGGHSLLATQVVSRVHEVFGVELPLRRLFEGPTVAELACAVEAARGEAGEAPPLVRRPRAGDPPASFAQERLWFLERFNDGSAIWNIPVSLRQRGRLDVAALAAAWNGIVRRHETLRTVFRAGEGCALQVVEPFVPRPLPVVDLRGAGPEEAARLARREAGRPFLLDRGPLWRVLLLRLGEEEHALVLVLHHVLSDGWSLGVLVRELAALYAGRALPELPVQYADFAVWQREWLRGEVLERQVAWWRERLAGAPAVELPADRPRPAVRSTRGARFPFHFDEAESRGVHALARLAGATPFMVLLAVLQALLARYAGDGDAAIGPPVGTPIANRNRAEIEGLIGFFVNNLVLRVPLAGKPGGADLVRRAREVTLDAYAHQDLPFEKLVEALRPERDLSSSPLFQFLLILQNAPFKKAHPDWDLGELESEEPEAKLDVTLALSEGQSGFRGKLEVRCDLFDEATALRMLGHFRRLLAAAAADPDLPWTGLEILSPAERSQLLDAWNHTVAPWRRACLHELVAEQAARTPASVAVMWHSERVTYGELVARAHRLAHRLRRLGVGPEVPVGVAAERTPDLLAALLGVLAAGGAYVPLDPAYPPERLAFLLADSQAGQERPVLVTESRVLDRLPPFPGTLLLLDREPPDEESDRAPGAPESGVTPDNLAYLIYTSGSTGRPKGVAITHASAAALLDWAAGVFPPEDLAGALASTSVTFDLSVFELFLPLSRGGTVVLADNALALPEMSAAGAAGAVRLVNTVPSAAAALARSGGFPPGVRTINLAGEPLKRALVDLLYAAPGVERVFNLYGPSEDTTYSTFVQVPAGDSGEPTIGVPIANTRACVLDAELRLLPVGVPGELFLGGEGLARGYLHRPELTAERFVPDPFESAAAGERLYRTGDRARRRADGELEFLGRLDHQVKIRGFRIEPGEIEAALHAVPGVQDAVVLAREDAAGSRLVAYVAPGVPDGLRDLLRQRLPAHMIPSALVGLAVLPLTPNGKVDRKALPDPEPDGTEEGAAPRTPTEELLAGIFAEVLGRERISLHDSFFDLGGHSLLATRVVSRVREVFGVDLPLRRLFEAPAVAALAGRVEAARRERELPPAPPLRPVPRVEDLPASFAQERLWFLEQIGTEGAYHLPLALRLRGRLDPAVLARALGEIVRRHEALRTTFRTAGGQVVQVISPPAPVPLPLVDLPALGEAGAVAAARRLAGEAAREPFDLARGPLLRALLIRRAAEEHDLLLNLHHVVTDGWSNGVLLRELGALYEAFTRDGHSPLADLPVQYADFAVWQREQLSGASLERHLSWWRERLEGAPVVLELPLARASRPSVRSTRGVRRWLRVPPDLAARLRSLGRREGATSFLVLLAAFQTLLHRWTAQEDFLLGTPLAGRSMVETEGLIGLFANLVPLRAGFSGPVDGPPFAETLRRARESFLGAHAHQDLPFERLVDELHPARSTSHAPLVQAVFSFREEETARRNEWAGLAIEAAEVDHVEIKFDLGLFVDARPDGWMVYLDAAADLFDPVDLLRLLDSFGTLLAEAAADPERPVGRLPIVAGPALHQALTEWNDTASGYPGEATIGRLFAECAAAAPEAVALEAGGEVWTYRELDERTNRLARHLIARGVGPEVRVGVCLNRSLEAIEAILAVVKAGGVYVPLEPAYPQERLALMIEDAAARVVITAAVLDRDREEIAARSAAPVESGTTPDSLAYVVYTSGSTGRPKGVAVPHRAVARLVRGAGFADLSADETWLQLAPIVFDASTLEIWGSLLNGARLVVFPGYQPSLEELGEAIERDGITSLWLTAGLFHQMVEGPLERLRGVRQLLAGGDVLSVPHVEKVLAWYPDLLLVNGYGPTENTTFTTCHRMRGTDAFPGSVPIGRPIAATHVVLLDRRLEPVPPGAVGELYTGGDGLARGYLGRPDLTAERFVPDPSGRRLYRTGDLARQLPDGNIEFLGRADAQVKVRGFRIEPGEIEAAICLHPEVRQAVVVLREERLVAYVVPAVPADLRARLQERLPDHLIPTAFVTLEALPLDPNGKVDRKALPAPGPPEESAGDAPRTPLEELLTGIWAEILRLERVGVHDDFFDLGGHSLLATRVVSRVREVCGVELPLRRLFEAPTVAGLAAQVELARRGTDGLQAPPILPVSRTGELPASFAQERLWFLDRFGADRASYNVPAALRLRGRLDAAALAASLGGIVRRHEALRTTFAAGGTDAAVLQRIAPALDLPLPAVDLGELPEPLRQTEASRLAGEEARRLFDLERGPLLRATLLRLGGEEHDLLLSLHHIVADGWSIGLLARELSLLYAAFVAGGPPPLPDLPVQYADFAVWQREWLRGEVLATQLGYWRERLSGAPAALDLPIDRPRPAAGSGRGGRVACALPAALTAGLQGLVRRRGATLFMALLAGFQALLARLTGGEDLPVGTPIANRNRAETEGLIGFFVNTLVLRGNLAGDPGFGAVLDQAREATLGAYAHQDLPFEKLVEELRPDRGHAPLFQVVLVLHNAPREALELPGLTITPVAADSGTAKFDLRLALRESSQGLTGDWLYSRDLFDAATIARLGRSLEAVLAAAVATSDLPLSQIPLLGEAERHQLVREWGDARPALPTDCLHRLFAAQAARTPEAVAVQLGAERLTYRELAVRANRLAWRLIALGVEPGDLVGLCLERSVEMVVAILGVLEAGAAYLPLDPAYPKERLAFALEDSRVAVLVTRKDLAAALPETAVHRVELDADPKIDRESAASPGVPVTPELPAYVIYTSGSTGRPKGVVVTHANVARLFTATGAWFGFGPGDVWTLFHSYAFDFSVWELWGALLYGGRLVVVPYRVSRSPEAFYALLRDEGVTVLNQTPSAFRQLLWAEKSAPAAERDLALRTVVFGGEALELASLAPWFERHGDARPGLVNMYGITETTVHVTYRPLSRRDVQKGEEARGSVIGRAIPDLSLRVLDRGFAPQPIGVPGEIHVGGAGLAIGYLGRPELTAERFVPDPFGDGSEKGGARLYRSGDLARTLPDGDLEYLGRIDHQVKIRGFRIELGEIETALAAQPEVREAAVLVREEASGERRLAAFLVLETEIEPAALRNRLAAVLPEHMIPAAFAFLPALPLTANGKIDRKALLALEETAPPARREIVLPRTELERDVAALWRSVLGLREEVGIEDDFFVLGGSSITGALLVNQLQEKLGEIVHVVVIFDAPTVRLMAEHLVENHPEAVRRIWGVGEGAARDGGGRVGEADVARMRSLIRPLAPLAGRGQRNPSAVFVLSPPRSGTTLLRVLLGGHPRLFAPPELELLSFNTLPERRAAYAGRDSFWLEGLIRAVMEVRGCGPEEAARITEEWEADGWPSRRAYRRLQEWLGGRILVDKTPSYALDPAILRRAEEDFDGAFYVHLLRHPCGMIRSFEEARLDQIFFRAEHGFARRELAELIWRVSHENVLRFLERIPPHRQVQVRFEELLRAPEAVLRGLCETLGLDFDPAMVRPYEDGSRRMTDGPHAASRMLGDVKFHTYDGIEESVAERWREHVDEGSLGDGTARLAVRLGYEMQAPLPSALPSLREKGSRPPLVPLSFAQERLWFLSRLEPESPFYNVPAALFLTGGLDVPALARSLAEIRRRHEGLRTVFAATPEGPVQMVTARPATDLPLVDLSGLAELAREGEASRLAGEEARRPFDLTVDPPLRLTLLRLEPRRHALLVTLHHIAADGWSVGIFLSETSALYGAFVAGLPSPLPELPIQTADFALWQRERLQGAGLAEPLAWWRERLSGAPALLELPTDRPRPAVQRFRGGEVRAVLPRGLAESLEELGLRHAATRFMTLLAAFQALLARWSGQDDVTIGSPVAGRLWPETEPLIGFFVNTLVLRARFDGDPTGDELLAAVRRSTVEAFAHQEIPFEKIVEELQPARSLAHAPLFQVLFSFQNAPRRAIELPGLEVAALGSGGGTAKFDLSLALAERDGHLAGGIEYDADLFDAATVARLLGGFEVLLRALAADPAQRVSDLPLLTPAERQQLLEHNDTGEAAAGLCLHQLCELRTDLAPDAEALLSGTERLTRAALDRRANRLARHLRRLGVGPESRVGVALERTSELVVALLAVLKAGGAYVPLDPAYPRERLALILEDAWQGLDAPLLLTQESLLGRLPEIRSEGGARILCVDRDRERIDRESDARVHAPVDPGNLAYLIYTSGSTGRPKGVAIEHRSAAALVAWAAEAFAPDELDGVLASTSVTFDLSIFELFVPLALGGRVVLAADALALPGLPAAGEVRLVNTVPSAIAELVRLGAVPPSVRTVNLAGEPLRRVLADSLQALPHVERLCNLYGPSEDTTYSTWTAVPAGTAAEPTIGRPLRGTRAWVVDATLNPQPAGVPGELCLAGAGLARGYLHRPDLTADRFVPDPCGACSETSGERLYRTGDRVRRRPDGELEFLGRLDHQVKVRGFRIELGEIEAALLAHPEIQEAAVLAAGEGGEKRLVAYLTPNPKSKIQNPKSALCPFLAATLPDYMIPAVFVLLDDLPRTPNGKIDRKALARIEPERAAESEGRGGPRGPVEELLAGIWAEVLRCGAVQPGDDFFALGGHSLLATRVVARAREVLGVELPLRALFETPTLAGLAAHVEQARRAARSQPAAPPLVRADRSGPLPASFAQERLWFLDRFGVTGPAYHLTNALRLRGPLRIDALAGALTALVRRHEALRTTFDVIEEQVVQVIAPPAPLPLPVLDLRSLAPEVRERALRHLAAEEARRLFDLACGPLLRTTLVALGEEEHALLLAMHHIASDGWSMQVIVRELAVLYAAAGEPSPADSGLLPLPIQYADFAAWQRSWLRGEALAAQTAYWRRQMAGAPALLALPLDRPRPAVQSFRGARRRSALPPRLAGELERLGRRHGASPFMTVLAAFQALLARLTGGFDVPVGSPVANRDRIETEGVVGFFVNTLVLRTDLSGAPPFGELLRRVREVVLDAHAHQDLPFEKLVEELRPERDLSHAPLFQVMLLVQMAGEPEARFPGLALEPVAMDTGTAKLDLLLAVAPERAGGLVGVVEYDRDLFDAPTIERLLAGFATLLEGAAADPARPVAELPLLPAAAVQQIVREWNDTAGPSPRSCLHQPFEDQAARRPEALAVVTPEERLTYGELDRQANRLAWHLRGLGVCPGTLVAVYLDRGAGMIVAVLAVHKAGGAYVPVETAWPAERVHGILADQRIAHVVTSAARRGELANLPPLPRLDHLICLEGDLAGLPGLTETAPPSTTGPEDLAYVIFTSGSTGRPKGVMVQHGPALNLIDWVNRTYAVGPGDLLLLVANLSFDLSVYDVFGTLAAGAALRVASAVEQRDPQALARLLCREPITFWDSAPAALQALVPYFPPPGSLPEPPALRLVFLSGDWIPVPLPDRVRESFPRAQVTALGGATEAAIWSNFFPVGTVDPAWASIPYGRPIRNARYHVLDAALAPCPVGVAGDLWIGGSCLSCGYAGEPAMTAEKYVPDPFAGEPGARLYRTGDRARSGPDGILEFLGRLDTQVKVRGFRIELGEIEAVLAAHPGVREAVVVVREDQPGDRRLIAYVIPALDPPPSALELRRFAQRKLPEYMLPSAFVPRESWPLSPTGKLDRKALPAPEAAGAADPQSTFEPPRTPLERTIAGVWCEVIGLDEVGARENFFDAGGHSLLMARVHARLQEVLARPLQLVDLFQFPTVESLARHLAVVPEELSRLAVRPVAARTLGMAIAVVGFAGRFPAAHSVDELWRNLCGGVEAIRFFSDEELLAAGFPPHLLGDPRLVKARGAIDGPDLFDAAFFDVPPREAQLLDPQQRLFLEHAWEALEHAGWGAPGGRPRVGVFAGVTENTYVHNLLADPELVRTVGRQQISIANNHDYLPSRVSYKLDLKGPSVNVQTACSTSLVAVHLACLSLLHGECEMALAGGASVQAREVTGYFYQEGGISSPDGHTRSFDARARGVVGGSGAGVVVLKRLEDALADGDTIHAVIQGTASNNDGAAKVGFTAPSVEGQAAAIRGALRAAGLKPADVDYVEAHGTATPLGDPVEVAALVRAFRTEDGEDVRARPYPTWIGSIKSSIGHLDAASGVSGLIKTVLAVREGILPASLHYEQPNPEIDFGPFQVVARTSPWPERDGRPGERPRRAGVSSFGIGGTNAHAVLEEAPARLPSDPPRHGAHLLVLSARTPAALDAATARLAGHLDTGDLRENELADVAFTLQAGRKAFRHRRILVCRDRADAVTALRNRDPERVEGGEPAGERTVAFLFPGQGTQHPRMAEDLYRAEPAFRAALDECCARLAPELGFDLSGVLFPPEGGEAEAARRLEQTSLAQPALFAVEHSLAKLWMEWGVRPAALLGHSIGEYVAACLAGVFSLEDALALVAARGRLMQERPAGAMLAVALAEDETLALIAAEGKDSGLGLAAVNAPRACVVSGLVEAVEALAARLEAGGLEPRRLHTSHAFHSALMEPAVEPFAERVRRVRLQPPQIPFVSNVTGTWIRPEEAADPGYWARHLRAPVRFAAGAGELLRLPGPVLLEVGPGKTLSTLARQHTDKRAACRIVPSLGGPRDRRSGAETLLTALGRLWLESVEVDWSAVHAGERRRRVPLPTYPFERKSFWIEPGRKNQDKDSKDIKDDETPALKSLESSGSLKPLEQTVAQAFRDLLGVDEVRPHDDFFDLGGSSLMAVQLGGRLRQLLTVDLPAGFLLETSTVRDIAALAEARRSGGAVEAPASCLVRLQAGAPGRRPLFLVHQVGGHVFTFRALARALGPGQPFYGLRSRGLEGGEEPFARIEEMAAHYLALVREVQPAGPYRIGGASMGGMVAFEMAQRLRATGEEVELLTLMDTPCLDQMGLRPAEDSDFVIPVFAGRVRLSPEELRSLSAEDQLAYACEKARQADPAGGLEMAEARRLFQVLRANVGALFEYVPQPYPGRLLYFRAEQRRPVDPPRPEIPWIELARGGVEILLAPGDHQTMHEPSNVQFIADRLRLSF